MRTCLETDANEQEACTAGGLEQVDTGSVLSWEEANAHAAAAGKRLPVTAELQAVGISVSDDLWTPIHTMTCDDQHTGRRDGSLGNGQNAWANIGPRRYQVEHPSWGLASSMTGGRSTHFWVSDGGACQTNECARPIDACPDGGTGEEDPSRAEIQASFRSVSWGVSCAFDKLAHGAMLASSGMARLRVRKSGRLRAVHGRLHHPSVQRRLLVPRDLGPGARDPS